MATLSAPWRPTRRWAGCSPHPPARGGRMRRRPRRRPPLQRRPGPDPRRPRVRARGGGAAAAAAARPHEVFGVCGAACLLRRELFAGSAATTRATSPSTRTSTSTCGHGLPAGASPTSPRAVVWHLGNASWLAGFERPGAGTPGSSPATGSPPRPSSCRCRGTPDRRRRGRGARSGPPPSAACARPRAASSKACAGCRAGCASATACAARATSARARRWLGANPKPR